MAEATHHSYLTLADLSIGESAQVVRYHDDGLYGAHLLRMGLIPGTHFKLVRKAPFGEPAEIRFRGFSLALRPNEARVLEVARS